jgi:hypothetical protein
LSHVPFFVSQAHLLGLLLCRDAVLQQPPAEYGYRAAEITGLPLQLALGPQQPFNVMSTAALARTLESMQAAWARQMYEADASSSQWAAAETLLRMLMLRVGALAMFVGTSVAIYDDPEGTEVLANGYVGLTHAALRGILDVLVVLFRHVDLYRRAVRVPHSDVSALESALLTQHAVEASKDEFYKKSMYFDALPGARLAYVHRFQGMFNCISQVVYFHNENYERRAHNRSRDAIDVLPVLLHMHPEVPVAMEDEPPPPNADTYWRLLAGRIYLVHNGTPLFSRCALQLFASVGAGCSR